MPQPNPQGLYCLTEAEMLALIGGIQGLKTYSRQLEESIRLSNAAATARR